MLVAVIIGPKGIDTLLVLSQVILSIVLPFAAFPLVYLTSSKRIMRVRKNSRVMNSGLGINGEMKKKGEDEDEKVAQSAAASASALALGGPVSIELEREAARSPHSHIHHHAQASSLTISTLASPHLDHDHDLNLHSQRKSVNFNLNRRVDVETASEDEWIDYSNHWSLTVLGYAIWLLIVIANVYVLGTL